MSNVRGLSRGDKRRNARLDRLREVLPFEHAVLGLDLADDKQVFAVTSRQPGAGSQDGAVSALAAR